MELPISPNQIATRVAKQQKRKIAVIPFRELGGQPTVFGTYLAEELVTQLVNTGNLDLVERTTLDKIFGEIKLNESGAIDPSTAKQVGRLAGADAIITGTITDLQSYVGVNCRMIDTETGRIFAAAEARIVKDDDVKKIMGMSIESGSVSHGPSVYGISDSQNHARGGHPAFATESYRLVADSLHRMGDNMELAIGLETIGDRVARFQIEDCYLLDEDGERWEQRRRIDSAGFREEIDMIPGTRVRSIFGLEGNSMDGARFTFVCEEVLPQRGRKIVVPGITTQ